MPNMGMTSKPKMAPVRSSLADALFSRTQQRVLGLLFGQPRRTFFATEIIAKSGGGSGAVQRELARLAASGLVTVSAVGTQKHYQANPAAPIYAELCGIAQKTVGLAEPLREALAPLARKIKAAFVYGSVAKRQDTAASDVDLMLISDSLTYADIFAALEAVGVTLGRAVNPSVLTSKELARRIKQEDSFLRRVLAQPKIWVIGDEDALRV